MPIVLIFQDVTRKAFPHSTATASKAITTYGPVYAKDLVYSSSYMIANKSDNADGVASSYIFARKSDSSVSEIARNVYTVNADMTATTYSLGCLRQDSNGNYLTDNVFEANAESMTVNSINSADSALLNKTLINYDGVAFSSDDASIYFGANQTFRIRFIPAGQDNEVFNKLAIESKVVGPGGTTGYSTRLAFTDETA